MMLLLVGCQPAAAQRVVTVLDAETLLPIADVSVRADTCRAVRTDALGRAAVPELFDSLCFSHLKYGRERLSRSEVADTMLMFSRAQMLPEVVVTALSPDLRRSIEAAHKRMVSEPRPSSLLSFDLGDMLDRRGRRDRKHLRKAKKILQEWDLK